MENSKLTDAEIITAIETTKGEEAKIIAAQNDRFRQLWGADFTIPGRVLCTQRVDAKGGLFVQAAMLAIMGFRDFNADNDPYGDHSFGCVEIEGQRLFWKIDLYDREFRYGSPEPANPAETRRVLTVMLPEEY